MGLLESTQDATDTALAVMSSQPLEPEKPTPKHSAWTVVPRAVGSAFLEVGGNMLDTANAFGQVSAAAGGISPGFDPGFEKNRQESLKAEKTLKETGINWRGEQGQANYSMAESLRPDPITAGVAENIIFGLTKGLSKAATAAVMTGTIGGAAAFGISEGMTEAEKLAREGVDIATRTKVGAVSASMNAAGMALPVAGNTLAKTLALAFTGGPASFVAQQAATRSILEHANYSEIAKQYDPLDPVGLTLATLLPAGFGAMAFRGARGAKGAPRDASIEPEAVRAASVDSVGPGIAQEHVDAAMVQNLTISRDVNESRLGGIGKQIAEGIVDPARGITETVIAAAKKIMDFVSGPGADVLNNRDKINFAAVEPDASARISELTGINIGPGARHEAAANMIRHSTSSHPDLTDGDWGMLPWIANRFDDAVLLKQQPQDQGPRIALSAIDHASGYAYVAEYRVGKSKGERLSLVTFFKDKPGTVRNYLETNAKQKRGGSAVGTPDAPVSRPGSESLTSETASGGYLIQSPSVGEVKDSHISRTVARIDDLHAQLPDMPVAIKEDGGHATLAEELNAIRREAREGTDTELGSDDAPLVKAAAECLLSRGG